MACAQVTGADKASGMVRGQPRDRGRTARAALLVLSAVALGALVAEYLVSGSAQLWLANGGRTAGALVAVIGVATAWRRNEPGDRLGWALLLAGCIAWLVGQLFWNVYGFTSFPASPNTADVSWLAFALISAAGVHRLGFGAGRSRRVSWLELVPLVVAVCSLMTALLWGDILSSTLSEAANITSLAYPIFYVSAALVMLQAALAGAIDLRSNPGIAAVLVGLGLEALAFILWSSLLLTGSYAVGTHPVNALWGIGMILIGVGAWRAHPAAPVAGFETLSRRRGGILPSLTFVTLAGFQVVFLAEHELPSAELVLSVGVAIVGGALIVRALILRRHQDALYEQLADRERELQAANTRISAESRRDALTGLGNRLRLSEDFAELAARAERYHHGYSLVLIDLDHFKQYNDANGHQAGDRALHQVAALLDGHARDGDRAYRYGGEELLLILPDQNLHDAKTVAERHLKNLEQVAIPHPQNPVSRVLTFSAGVALAQPGETPDEVLKRADQALYTAKDTGRDRIVLAVAPRASTQGADADRIVRSLLTSTRRDERQATG